MDGKIVLKVLVITGILLVVVFSAYKYTLLNSNNTIKHSNIVSAMNNSSKKITFKLFDPNKVTILRPTIYLRLKNGSVLAIKNRNPFKFEITSSISSLNKSINHMHIVKVYKVSINRNPSYVFRFAKKLNIDINKLYFNNITKTYIYYNTTHIFEYNIETGFFRFKLRNTSQVEPSIQKLPKNAFIAKAINYLKTLGLLYPNGYTVKVGNYLEVNGKPAIVTIVVQPLLDGIVVNNLAITVLLTSEGKLVGIEGVVLASIKPIGSYALKPPSKALKDLERYIREGRPMTDWYISWLAFTKMKVENLKLVYYVTPNLYVVPVYIVKGSYELHYDGINDKGPIKAIVLAIEP